MTKFDSLIQSILEAVDTTHQVGGVTVSIDKGVKSAYQDSANTVRLLTPRLGGGGIGGESKVGVVKLTFSSPIVSIS